MPGRRTRRVRAIVLGRTKLSEQDLILTMLAQDGQELRCVAKGARRPGGRLAGRTELFCEADLLLSCGRALDVISEASVVDAHAGLRGDLDRVAAASAVAEVARLTCLADVADPYLHPLCSRALRACEQAGDRPHLDLVVAAHAVKAVSHGGWRPQLATCVMCGDAAVSHLSVEGGGALCASCAKDVAGVEKVGAQRLAWLDALVRLTFDELLAAAVDRRTSAWLARASWRWAATQLDARLRAHEFYQAGATADAR